MKAKFVRQLAGVMAATLISSSGVGFSALAAEPATDTAVAQDDTSATKNKTDANKKNKHKKPASDSQQTIDGTEKKKPSKKPGSTKDSNNTSEDSSLKKKPSRKPSKKPSGKPAKQKDSKNKTDASSEGASNENNNG